MPGQVKISKGRLVPDIATVRKLARAIGKEVRADPKVAQQLRKNPRVFLGDRGIPIDIQKELLMDAGLSKKRLAALGYNLDICITASAGGCCITCWDTEVLFPGGNLPVEAKK
jgi:hypothetical protein